MGGCFSDRRGDSFLSGRESAHGGISFGSGVGEVSKKIVRWRWVGAGGGGGGGGGGWFRKKLYVGGGCPLASPPHPPPPPPLWEILLTVESTIILATITHKYPFIGWRCWMKINKLEIKMSRFISIIITFFCHLNNLPNNLPICATYLCPPINLDFFWMHWSSICTLAFAWWLFCFCRMIPSKVFFEIA